jgi:hypothetical protein
MTKEEAIQFIENCNDTNYGFFVCAVSRDDLTAKCPTQMVDEFDSLETSEKEQYLSNLASRLGDMYENEHFHFDFLEVDMNNLLED